MSMRWDTLMPGCQCETLENDIYDHNVGLGWGNTMVCVVLGGGVVYVYNMGVQVTWMDPAAIGLIRDPTRGVNGFNCYSHKGIRRVGWFGIGGGLELGFGLIVVVSPVLNHPLSPNGEVGVLEWMVGLVGNG